MNDSDYTLLYAQGTKQHEDIVLRCAGFTPDEEALFTTRRSTSITRTTNPGGRVCTTRWLRTSSTTQTI